MKTILIRATSGAIYVSLIAGSIIFSKTGFSALFLFLNLVAIYEFVRFKEKNSKLVIQTALLSSIVYIVHYLWLVQVLPTKYLWCCALIPIIVSLLALFSNTKKPHVNIGNGLFSLLYITLPLILLNQINYSSSEQSFSWLVLIIFILIWVNDTFAYLTGIAIGKHKMFKRVSPKKSWEGFFGGVVFSVIAAWFLFPLSPIENRVSWLILSLFISVASVMGDFVESLLKRDAGIKDSGKLIPGHGGVLDRIDSLLFVVPVVYVYLQL